MQYHKKKFKSVENRQKAEYEQPSVLFIYNYLINLISFKGLLLLVLYILLG